MPWAVISGVASRAHGLASMDAVHQHLASEFGAHLCWPSYTQVDDTIGFVTRVYPGVKENGSIFSHPNAWPIIAETMLGRGTRALEYYDALAPYWQNDRIERRVSEPYVYAQFVYGRDHALYGRAENPWLTGTAGWTYTAATKYILGVRPDFDALVVDPCVPAAWDGFTVRRVWRDATYDIEVRNPAHVECGVASVEAVPVDSQQGTGGAAGPLADGGFAGMRTDPRTGRRVARLAQAQPGRTVRVVVTLGPAA
jgi:N,N'-diacetylchitobiose phosphorylase